MGRSEVNIMTAKQRIIDSMLESQIHVSEALTDRNEKIADILSKFFGLQRVGLMELTLFEADIRAEIEDYMDEQITDGEVEDKEKLEREEYNREMREDR